MSKRVGLPIVIAAWWQWWATDGCVVVRVNGPRGRRPAAHARECSREMARYLAAPLGRAETPGEAYRDGDGDCAVDVGEATVDAKYASLAAKRFPAATWHVAGKHLPVVLVHAGAPVAFLAPFRWRARPTVQP